MMPSSALASDWEGKWGKEGIRWRRMVFADGRMKGKIAQVRSFSEELSKEPTGRQTAKQSETEVLIALQPNFRYRKRKIFGDGSPNNGTDKTP